MSKNPAAVALGRLGGKATSKAKADAARANGAKGGRPKGIGVLGGRGPMKRRFIDAPDAIRCTAVIRIGKAEHDTARCGRAVTVGDLCTQHAKIEAI